MKSFLPLIHQDPYLKPFSKIIEKRFQKNVLRELDFTQGVKSLTDCFNNHLYFGLHHTETSWIIREWSPAAYQLYLTGDFSDWRLNENLAFKKQPNGIWELELPLYYLKHGDLYKILTATEYGAVERLPAYVTRAVQDPVTKIFSAQVWEPEQPYQFKHQAPEKPEFLLIYEAHVGMAQEFEGVGSYHQFKMHILPKIKRLGYNAIQLMAIQEHPYYGSFGYQVSNFFAPSSRFGTPDELKELIDEAHRLGLYVMLDIVHSHAVANEGEGLNRLDGSDNLYFHKGERGFHPAWKSKCFNYGKPEVLGFLLSNLKYWMTEFRFDGFRFDGVTSMLYFNHGLGVDYLSYSQYFDGGQDEDAMTFLYLANRLIHELSSEAVTIAEEVSGYPGTAAPCTDGGLGFDYRMSMGIADFWIKTLKETPDECWNPGEIFFRLTDKRKEEHTVAYTESHDQAMVGDKTIIFRLLDAKMYTSMSRATPDLAVDRGISLSKIILFTTLNLTDKAFLNFMGNEFGHPEWIDFPREGNGWSYKHARRQWSLSENTDLKYRYLLNFHQALIQLIHQEKVLFYPPKALVQDSEKQILIFERGALLFIINLSPNNAYTDYQLKVRKEKYTLLLDSEQAEFGGFERLKHTQEYVRLNYDYIQLYLPNRFCLVLKEN